MFNSKNRTETELDRQQKKELEKEQKENQLKWHNYLISLLLVLAGTVFIIYKSIDISFICRFTSLVFVAAGVICILTYIIKDISTGYYRLDLVYGIMLLFVALLFYTKEDVVAVYFPIIAGCTLVANGVVKLQHSIDMKRIDRKMKKVTEMWLVVMIFALLCISTGAVIVYLTPQEQRTLFIFIGVSLIVAGLSDIFTHIVFNHKVRLFRSGDYVTEEPETIVSEPEATDVTEPVYEPEIVPETDIVPEPEVIPGNGYITEEEDVTANMEEAETEPAPEEETGDEPETTEEAESSETADAAD